MRKKKKSEREKKKFDNARAAIANLEAQLRRGCVLCVIVVFVHKKKLSTAGRACVRARARRNR